MGTSWREWILDFVWVMVWFVRAVVWYLAGCAITFMILAVPYLPTEEQQQPRTNNPHAQPRSRSGGAGVSPSWPDRGS